MEFEGLGVKETAWNCFEEDPKVNTRISWSLVEDTLNSTRLSLSARGKLWSDLDSKTLD
jgi:hypothetical protein